MPGPRAFVVLAVTFAAAVLAAPAWAGGGHDAGEHGGQKNDERTRTWH